MDKKRIVLIGYGAIARDVLDVFSARYPLWEIAVLHRTQSAMPDLASLKNFTHCDDVIAWRPHLVIEAAGHEAVRHSVPPILERGLPVLVSSVGALHNGDLLDALLTKAETGKTKLLLPSGAIGALDYVRACRFTKDQSIVYESRKPVRAWEEELQARGYDTKTMNEPVVLFEGTAREAARRYPANLNVAATLALAGIGMDQTRVRVIADPVLDANQHQIHATSDHGTMSVTFANAVSAANPKSSRIVAKSIVAAAQNHFSFCQFL